MAGNVIFLDMSFNKSILVPDTYYHICNQAVGREKLFIAEENYYYFLGLFRKYICPVADVFSFCLVPNRFDFLIRIRNRASIYRQMRKLRYPYAHHMDIEPKFLLQQFSNFFNAYTKALNKQQNRKGRLFIQSFHRKALPYFEKFTRMIHDMHMLPVRKGLCRAPEEWRFTSYMGIMENRGEWLQTHEVLNWFGSLADYIHMHQQPPAKKFECHYGAGGIFSGY